jgi:hypothetical protein
MWLGPESELDCEQNIFSWPRYFERGILNNQICRTPPLHNSGLWEICFVSVFLNSKQFQSVQFGDVETMPGRWFHNQKGSGTVSGDSVYSPNLSPRITCYNNQKKIRKTHARRQPIRAVVYPRVLNRPWTGITSMNRQRQAARQLALVTWHIVRRRHHASEVQSSSRHGLSAMYPGVKSVRSLTEWRNTPGRPWMRKLTRSGSVT